MLAASRQRLEYWDIGSAQIENWNEPARCKNISP